MLVSRDIINGLTPVAEGYKIFNNDWTADQSKYDFKDPTTGKAVGTVHQAYGEIICCENGFHFCENPLDCLSYYPMVQWNKFAKVRGYGQIARHDEDSKVAVEILEIAEILTWDDFLEVIKQRSNAVADTENNISGGRYISGGCDISGGYGISGGRDIYGGYHISGGYNIYGGRSIYGGNNINGGYDINGGCDISGGRDIYGGYHISGGYNIYGGRSIYGGYNIYGGHDIYGVCNIFGGCDIYGGENCMGAYDIMFCRNCQGCKSCICCLDYTGKNAVFNQQASEQHVNEIKNNIRELAGDWFPKFTNAYALYNANGQNWSSTPAPKIDGTDRTYAYAGMPQELVDYIKSLPEFDANIWREITGRN